MTTLGRVTELAAELQATARQSVTRAQADALARELVNAREALIAMGPLAREAGALADARAALDAAELALTVRYNTRPAVADVLRLVRAAGVSQDMAVLLLGGTP